MKEFLFPNDISVENQRREKMFNEFNNKALRATANKTAAKRIMQFIDPKNIVNNPRRISGGGFSLLTSLQRRLSKEMNIGSGVIVGEIESNEKEESQQQQEKIFDGESKMKRNSSEKER